MQSFQDDYLQPLPTDPEERTKVESANIWRAIYCVIAFMMAFSYLKPYPEYGLGDTQQRINRLVVCLTLIYMCWLIFMLNMRPE